MNTFHIILHFYTLKHYFQRENMYNKKFIVRFLDIYIYINLS